MIFSKYFESFEENQIDLLNTWEVENDSEK